MINTSLVINVHTSVNTLSVKVHSTVNKSIILQNNPFYFCLIIHYVLLSLNHQATAMVALIGLTVWVVLYLIFLLSMRYQDQTKDSEDKTEDKTEGPSDAAEMQVQN